MVIGRTGQIVCSFSIQAVNDREVTRHRQGLFLSQLQLATDKLYARGE